MLTEHPLTNKNWVTFFKRFARILSCENVNIEFTCMLSSMLLLVTVECFYTQSGQKTSLIVSVA